MGSGRHGSPVVLAKEPYITFVSSLTDELGRPQRVTSDLCQNHTMWSTLYITAMYVYTCVSHYVQIYTPEKSVEKLNHLMTH